jgi:WD40 repeat protein
MTPNLASLKHHGPITSLFINENLKSYIFAAIKNDLIIIKIDSEKVDTVINDHNNCIKSISACTQRSHNDVNYNIICTGGYDGYIYGYDILTLDKILSLEVGLLINSIDVKFISCMEVCLVLGSFEGDVQVYELTKNIMLHNIHCSDKPIHAVAIIETIVPGFIIAGADLEIKLYDLREGIHLISLYGCHTDCIRTINVTIDPWLILISGGFDNKTIVYDIHKLAQNDENMRLLLSHLKLKPFKFESKKVYLFDNSIDETSSVITEVSTFLTDLNKDNDETK